MVNQVGNNVYGEVEALCVLLGYKTANAGCCKVGQQAGAGAAGCVMHWARQQPVPGWAGCPSSLP
jgi:hypothetical protein